MARRRDPEKPVERLRSTWNSTADLEETLVSMFHPPATVPGDKLAPEEPAKLTPPTPDKLSPAPPDSLAGDKPVYQTLDGVVVDAKCIRPIDSAQHGHTHSEHIVYTAMWRMLGSQTQEAESREGMLPMRQIADRVSLSLRNLRRVLHSLMEKMAVDVTEYEDKTKSMPRRYRVWGPRAVVERRRRAGYTHIYRNRNLITLAKPQSK